MAEAEHLTQAAQLFVEAEAADRAVDDLGFEDNIIDAVQCYEQAVEIYLRVKRTSFAATLYAPSTHVHLPICPPFTSGLLPGPLSFRPQSPNPPTPPYMHITVTTHDLA